MCYICSMSNRILIVTDILESVPSGGYNGLINSLKDALREIGTHGLKQILAEHDAVASYTTKDGWAYDTYTITSDRLMVTFKVNDITPYAGYTETATQLRTLCQKVIIDFMSSVERYSALNFTLTKKPVSGIYLSSMGYNNHIESNAIRLETLTQIADHIKNIEHGGRIN